MTLILRSDHYLDSPADVIVFETSSILRTITKGPNGEIKRRYPGWYELGNRLRANARQGSVIICESDGAVPGRSKSLVLAGVCLYSPGVVSIRPKIHIYPAIQHLFHWFWSQDRFTSIGTNLIGGRATSAHISTSIHKHIEFWNEARNGRADRDLYLHSIESTYLADIESTPWAGPFKKIMVAYPIFPQLEPECPTHKLPKVKKRTGSRKGRIPSSQSK